jgi:adenylate cyclase class IV
MKNIELKVYLKDRKKMAAAVKKIGAKFQGDLFQVDTYYRVKTGRLKTREINGREFKLVYYTRPDLKRRKVSDYEIIEFKKDQFAKVKDLFRILFGELV